MKKVNWYKVVLFAAIAAALFFLGRSCGIKSVIKNTGRDTTIYVYTDTGKGKKPIEVDIRYDSIIYKDRWKTEYDTLWGPPEIRIDPADTAAILRDYYASRFYTDTQKLKRGQVVINDTVNRNEITGRQVIVSGTDTTITVTTVLRPPKRMVGYFTLSGMGHTRQPFGGVGAGFGLKLPNDRVYQVEYKMITDGRDMIEGRVFFPIRLLKKTNILNTN